MSKQRSTIVLVVLLLLLLLGWWAIPTQSQYPTTTPPELTEVPQFASLPALTIQHSVEGQVHTYTGTLPLALCESFSSGVQTAGGNPLKVRLSFTTSKATCSATTTNPGVFSVAITDSASTTPSLSVTINTQPVSVSVVEN